MRPDFSSHEAKSKLSRHYCDRRYFYDGAQRNIVILPFLTKKFSFFNKTLSVRLPSLLAVRIWADKYLLSYGRSISLVLSSQPFRWHILLCESCTHLREVYVLLLLSCLVPLCWNQYYCSTGPCMKETHLGFLSYFYSPWIDWGM